MTNEFRSRNDRNARRRVRRDFGFRHLIIPSTFVIRASSFLSFVNDQLVAVRIAELRHSAHRRFSLFDIEGDAAFFKFAARSVNIFHLKSDRRAVE